MILEGGKTVGLQTLYGKSPDILKEFYEIEIFYRGRGEFHRRIHYERDPKE